MTTDPTEIAAPEDEDDVPPAPCARQYPLDAARVLRVLPATEDEAAARLGCDVGAARAALCRLLGEGRVEVGRERRREGRRVVAVWRVPAPRVVG